MTKESRSAVKRLRGLMRNAGYLLGVSKPDDPIISQREHRKKVMEEMLAKARAINRVNRLRRHRDTLRQIQEARHET